MADDSESRTSADLFGGTASAVNVAEPRPNASAGPEAPPWEAGPPPARAAETLAAGETASGRVSGDADPASAASSAATDRDSIADAVLAFETRQGYGHGGGAAPPSTGKKRGRPKGSTRKHSRANASPAAKVAGAAATAIAAGARSNARHRVAANARHSADAGAAADARTGSRAGAAAAADAGTASRAYSRHTDPLARARSHSRAFAMGLAVGLAVAVAVAVSGCASLAVSTSRSSAECWPPALDSAISGPATVRAAGEQSRSVQADAAGTTKAPSERVPKPYREQSNANEERH